jgi:ribonuclease BN (tRNA processing enzyme)
MAKLIVLGSSNAIPTRDHENTHLAVLCQNRTVLIDCVSNPMEINLE